MDFSEFSYKHLYEIILQLATLDRLSITVLKDLIDRILKEAKIENRDEFNEYVMTQIHKFFHEGTF